jgi:transcriptional regulator with XRE-family HTH domain
MHIEPMANVGSRVRTLRTEKDMSLFDLAQRAKLSKGLLSKLENDESPNPSLETLYKIAEALDTSVAEILESEQVQLKRFLPSAQPAWLDQLVRFLKAEKKKPNEDILSAIYLLKHRKAVKKTDLEQAKFLYQSIENSFANLK